MNDEPKQSDSKSSDEEATAQQSAADTSSRGISAGVATLLIVATLFTFLAFVSVWFNRQVLQTSYWTDTSSELLESEEVRDALGAYIVDQLFTNVDVEGELTRRLPPDLTILAGPATNGLRELALRATDRGLASPQFQSTWKTANQNAHTLFIKILDGEGEYVNIDQGVVTVDVRELVTEVANEIGIGEKLVAKIPPSVGTLEVLQSDELKTAQNVKRVSDVTAVLFPILAFALYGLALFLATGRRRRVVTMIGVSWVALAFLTYIAISLGEGPFVSSLAATSAVEPAVTDVYGIVTSLLHSMATSILVTGVLIILAALVAGPSRAATAIRRHNAPYLREYPVASASVAALAYLLLIALVPTTGFRSSGGLLLNTVLVIAGFLAYRHICIKEFPNEPVPDIGAWASERWQATRKKVEDRRGRSYSMGRKGVGETETLDQMERLADLHERGVLTDDEFKEQKSLVLSRQSGEG